jgi:hypothetical protein
MYDPLQDDYEAGDTKERLLDREPVVGLYLLGACKSSFTGHDCKPPASRPYINLVRLEPLWPWSCPHVLFYFTESGCSHGALIEIVPLAQLFKDPRTTALALPGAKR